MKIKNRPDEVFVRSNDNQYIGNLQIRNNTSNLYFQLSSQFKEKNIDITGYVGKSIVPSLFMAVYTNISHHEELLAGQLIFVKKEKVEESDVTYFLNERLKEFKNILPEIKEYFHANFDHFIVTAPTGITNWDKLKEHNLRYGIWIGVSYDIWAR